MACDLQQLDRLLAGPDNRALGQPPQEAADPPSPLWPKLLAVPGLLQAGPIEQLAIVERLGYHRAAETYLGAVVQAGGLLGPCTGPLARRLGQCLLQGLQAGRCAVVLGDAELQAEPACTLTWQGRSGWRLDGRLSQVPGACGADWLIVVAHGDGACRHLLAVPQPSPGLRRRDWHGLDGARVSELRFEAVAIRPGQRLVLPGDAAARLQALRLHIRLAWCAEALGVLQRLLEQAGASVGPGRVDPPLRRRLADMHLSLAQARALVSLVHAAGAAGPCERRLCSAQVAVLAAIGSIGPGALLIDDARSSPGPPVWPFFGRAAQIAQCLGPPQPCLQRLAELLDTPSGAGD